MTLREFVNRCAEDTDIRVSVGCEGFVDWNRDTYENELGRNMAEYEVLMWTIFRDYVNVYTA